MLWYSCTWCEPRVLLMVYNEILLKSELVANVLSLDMCRKEVTNNNILPNTYNEELPITTEKNKIFCHYYH